MATNRGPEHVIAGSPDQKGGLFKEAAARRVVSADLASLLGDFMVVAVMPFAVLSVGGSPAWVAAVLAGQGLSLAVFLPIGGVLGDRFPRKSVMVGADLLRLGSQSVLAVLLLTGNASLLALLVAQVVHGIGTGVFMPAASAVVPDAVKGDSVQGTNALKVVVRGVSMALGPALGAMVVAVSGVGLAMAADGATFAVSAALLNGLDVGEKGRSQGPSAGFLSGLRRWWEELREGWRQFWALRWMRWTTLQFTVVNAVVIAPFYVLGPTASERWFDGAGSWALILVGVAIGQLAGGVVGLRWRPRRPLVAATIAMCLWAVPLVVLASQTALAFVVVAAVFGGFAVSTFMVLWETTLQTQVREEARSRVSSFEQFGSLALVPFGFLLGGWMEEGIGTSAGLLVGAAVLVVASVGVLAAPSVRQVRSSEAVGSASEGAGSSADRESGQGEHSDQAVGTTGDRE